MKKIIQVLMLALSLVAGAAQASTFTVLHDLGQTAVREAFLKEAARTANLRNNSGKLEVAMNFAAFWACTQERKVALMDPSIRPTAMCTQVFLQHNDVKPGSFMSVEELVADAINPDRAFELPLALAAVAAPAPAAAAPAASAPNPAEAATPPAPTPVVDEQARAALEALNVELAKAEEARRRAVAEAAAARRAANEANVKRDERITSVEGRLNQVEPKVEVVEKAVEDYGNKFADLVPKDWFWWLAALVALILLCVAYLMGSFGGFKRELNGQKELNTLAVNTANTAVETANDSRNAVDGVRQLATSADKKADDATSLATAADAKATEALTRHTVVEWSSGNGRALKGKTDALGEGECHTEIIGLSDGRRAELKICGADKDNLVIHGIAGTKICLRSNVVKTIFAGANVLKDGKGKIVADTRFERFVEA